MQHEHAAPDQPPLVLEAVLKAADVARIGIAVSLFAPEGSRCVYATATAARLLGVPLDQLVGGSLRDFMLPEHLARMNALSQAMMENPSGHGGGVEVVARRPDGTQVELELAYAPTTVAGKPAVVTFLVNVGEQRATARQVRETAQRLAQLIERTPDAVVISRRGLILEANPAAARMLGVESAQHLVGLSLGQFVVGEDAAMMRERMAAVARGENPGPPRVYRAARSDGQLVMVEIASFASEYEGQPAIIAFGRDVTDRERLQEQLARTDRLAALGTLAAGVAHEINNPLAALALNAEVVARAVSRATLSEADRETGAAALTELRNSVERMTAIVRDLTGFSRTSTEQFGAVSLAGVVERATRLARHATRQRATVRLELSEVPPVFGHAGKLEQVLLNLLVNAAQAFPPERTEAQNEIVVRTLAADPRHVVLEVSDNGQGIPAAVAGRVFDPFFTTKPAGEGTGLGLFISHNAVRQMDGEIVVISRPAGGTTMRVVLRVAREYERARAAEAQLSSSAGARGRVLIVDDEVAMCRSLKSLLTDHHDVSTALGGEEALALLGGGARFDVILCDLMMPGVTGMDLHARLAREQPGLEKHMVFMTGGAFTEEARAFLAGCANLRLQKPFAATELEAALQQVIALPS
ncbi:MAG: PAS domain S-box protein [Archangium sp.]|nr:PAS domain S-box protein [Archangium sp.]